MNEENRIPQVEVEKSSSLDWNDLLSMARNNWGLRHVSDLNLAKKEFNEGIELGDAISISTPNSFISEELLEDESRRLFPYLSRVSQMKLVNEADKPKVLLSFEQAIKNFIRDSVGIDISKQPIDMETRELEKQLRESSMAFLVANFSRADKPDDIVNFYKLGKCGKQSVSKEDMVFLISLSSDDNNYTENLLLTEDELNLPVNKDIYAKIRDRYSEKIWAKFVNEIKKQNKE